MLITFDTLELRTACEDETAATSAFGVDRDAIFSCLADLRSADVFSDLPPVDAEVGGAPCAHSMPAGALRLVFVPGHYPPPVDANGELDVSKVDRVKIISILRND